MHSIVNFSAQFEVICDTSRHRRAGVMCQEDMMSLLRYDQFCKESVGNVEFHVSRGRSRF